MFNAFVQQHGVKRLLFGEGVTKTPRLLKMFTTMRIAVVNEHQGGHDVLTAVVPQVLPERDMRCDNERR